MRCPSCLAWITHAPCCSQPLTDNATRFVELSMTEHTPDLILAADRNHHQAVKDRFYSARQTAIQGGYGPQFDAYYEAVTTDSHAVVSLSYGALLSWLKGSNSVPGAQPSDRGRYLSLYKFVRSGLRAISLLDAHDITRRRVDAIMSPYYEEEICFAALSLDGRGVEWYGRGQATVTLDSSRLPRWATVFEENQIAFFERRQLGPFDPLPDDVLTDWESRGLLVAAKAVESGALFSTSSFAEILLPTTGSAPGSVGGPEWVEVRLFGGIARDMIESVGLRHPPSADHTQQIEYAEITERLDQLGLKWKVRP
jgi:hypothetical protein